MRAGSLYPVRRGHPIRAALVAPRPTRVSRDDNDLKLFVLSFTAFFISIYTFLL